MLPPDPSGLSISGRDHDLHDSIENEHRRSTSAFLPATPTTVRDYQPLSHQHLPSWTPRTGRSPQDLDASVRRRFGKVELIGTGEFSQVYRVVQTSRPDPSQGPSSSPFSTSTSSQSSIQGAEHVYAVKKSRRPYLGTRDRMRKLQEVEVLKRLGQSDHTVHLIDSWEERDHLYIQTEFCEEGSLDLFLAQVGRKARLDDFRIWKIMLELCLVGVLSLSIFP